MSKALLIQSYTTLTTGIQGDWNELNMAIPISKAYKLEIYLEM